MLAHLSIRHYALIDHLEIDFQDGLNILTGETGSGKSIILGALGLILGERAEKRVVMEGETKCIVEGTFLLDEGKWKPVFQSNDLDFDGQSILRREVLESGKSRAFINDTPVNLKVLREVALDLVDIHSQHQTIQLNNPQFQLDVVDAFAGAQSKKSKYSELFHEYTSLKKRLTILEEKLVNERREIDFVNFQLGELKEVDLDAIDELEIEEEFKVLSNSEEIATKLHGALHLLGEGDTPILNGLKQASDLLADISEYAAGYKELYDRIKSTIIELEDVEGELNSSAEKVEINPDRLSQLEELKSSIFKLEQKHMVSGVEELVKRREELSERLSGTENLESEIEELKIDLDRIYGHLVKAGEALSKMRQSISKRFKASLQELLGMLNMSKARVEIEFTKTAEPQSSGFDQVELLFSANVGRSLEPLKNVASGGELSRLMLSIKKLSAGEGKTIILDEIDTGVSGEVAHSMGKIMKEMGQNQQVLSITHLPQIASKGQAHFKVFKEEFASRTETRIERLSENERVEEIASMLSGKETTAAAIDNAKELLLAN
ncbi:MAG: DNA repair protein RecN [Flavobacteriales bacterium]|nr:DNA repair protein RecN [Flavobacteriales bacterium]